MLNNRPHPVFTSSATVLHKALIESLKAMWAIYAHSPPQPPYPSLLLQDLNPTFFIYTDRPTAKVYDHKEPALAELANICHKHSFKFEMNWDHPLPRTLEARKIEIPHAFNRKPMFYSPMPRLIPLWSI